MVNRIAKYAALFLAGLALVSVAIFVLLVGTESGSRWLLSRLVEQAPAGISFSTTKGRLTDRLVLHDLEIFWENGRLGIEEVELEWSPWSLTSRHLKIENLALRKLALQVQKASEKKTGPLGDWPEMPTWLPRWQVDVSRFQVVQGTYSRPGEESVAIGKLEGAIKVNDGVLTLQKLQGSARDYNVDSSLTINLLRPHISGGISLSSEDDREGLSVNFNLNKSAAAQLLAGPFEGSISVPGWPAHRFRGHFSLNRDSLEVSDMVVERAGTGGLVSSNLELSWGEETVIKALVEFRQWGVSLQQEHIVLNGTLSASGPIHRARGEFDLSSSGSRLLNGRLAGDWQLNADKLRADIRSGTWLGGTLAGSVDTSWKEPQEIQARVKLRRLDPALMAEGWNGLVNLDAALSVLQIDNQPHVNFDAQFIDSRLRGLPLSGLVQGAWQSHSLRIDTAHFSGDGFSLAAAGSLNERLHLDVKIEALGGLLPQAKGQLDAQGWIGFSDDLWNGELSVSGSTISYDALDINNFTLSLAHREHDQPAEVIFSAGKMTYDAITLQSVEATLHGYPDVHRAKLNVSFPDGVAEISLTGQKAGHDWIGTFEVFELEHDEFGKWAMSAPATAVVNAKGYSLDAFNLLGSRGALKVTGGLQRSGRPENLQVHLDRVPLPLFSTLLNPLTLTGELDMVLQCDQRSCRAEAAGVESVVFRDRTVKFDRTWLSGNWDDAGLVADLEVKLAGDALVTGQLSSAKSLQSYQLLPLRWRLDWRNLPLAGIYRLPERVTLNGAWQGHADGVLLTGTNFKAELRASLKDTSLSWDDEDSGMVKFVVDEAKLDGLWQEDTLAGSLNMVMAERGQLSSSWQMPIPARLPVEPVAAGSISGHLDGWFAEKGLFGILWPDLLQETGGEFAVDMILDGTWLKPEISGEAALRNGRTYVPATGIALDDIEMKLKFDEQRLVVESLAGHSGPGSLALNGRIDLNGWHPAGIDLKVAGREFALVNLPELQVRVNPNLRFAGTRDQFRLSGEIEIPYFLATGRSVRNPVQLSPDVVVVDRDSADVGKDLPFRLNTNVKLILGEQVLVKMFGLDARLGGQLDLNGVGRQDFRGAGIINVEEGNFSTYGVKLKIDKGRAIFADGPLDNPALDILAVKNVNETKAGVKIRGTAKSPEVKLYSEPDLPDTDILSLIVLGRPLDQAGAETDPLMFAAGALLSAGDSAVLRNRLQSQLGLDSITAESDGDGNNDTILRLGKYLTPDLYLSYGYALFGQRSEVGLRYRIHEGWEAESTFGLESGADIFYRFEFD